MESGQILVAEQAGTYVIKMLGDVRLTLAMSFDAFIDDMFADANFLQVVFDLSEVQAVDSTTLGLMAKISILGKERLQTRPMIVSGNPSIDRLLDSMGFSDIFDIVQNLDLAVSADTPLAAASASELAIKDKVIEAHRVLADMNEGNREAFKDLLASLEQP